MSNFKTLRLNDDELTSSSDEKMDTGSESFLSQDTPNLSPLRNLKTELTLSSDFEGDHPEPVLRLQNPEILRLSAPEQLNESLMNKMSHLNIESPKTKPPKSLGISPPKFSSTLTLTTNHPLMSPDENYPDLIPKKIHKIEDEKDLSLSSIEDERIEENGFYSPQRNTSKNNLYFSEVYVTAESLDLDLTVPPDVARVDKVERRKIVPNLKDATPHKGHLLQYIDKKIIRQSTPKSLPVDISVNKESNTVAEWCESPSLLRALPNFELPIEMSSSIGLHNDLDSPEALSASTPEDKSAYQALLDPYTGSVALRHTPAPHRSPGGQRRKIHLPPEVEEDRCSLDSVSVCSMESEEEPPEPDLQLGEITVLAPVPQDLCDNSVSKSTNTLSECSDPIPEYSAAEELSNERAWISVPRGNGHATCDMKVIEPYKRVISHGGYDPRGAALIVFSACHLPDCARPDYTYVMDNLFLYVIWTLERLVTDEYVLVYLHGSAGRRKLPTFHWLHECYKLIDRRLRKSLKHLYLVHPTFWLKSFVILTKPFVSSKFFRKLSYVRSLAELMQQVPVEPNAIPEVVKQFDATKR